MICIQEYMACVEQEVKIICSIWVETIWYSYLIGLMSAKQKCVHICNRDVYENRRKAHTIG